MLKKSLLVCGLLFSSFLGGMASQSLYLACAQTPMVPVGPSFPPKNGTSQFVFNSWASQLWELSQGSSGSPVTNAGPLFKISRTEQVSAATCNGNPVDGECNAALAVYSIGSSSDGMQTTAAYLGAQGAGARDNVAISTLGRTVGAGSGIGTGAYLEGRRDVNTGNNLGAEVRSNNNTATAELFNQNGFNSGGLWVTASGLAKSACGTCIGNAGQSFDVGFGVTGSAALTWAFVSPGFSVDPSGNETALSYSVGGSPGVSCSGSPSAGFASLSGIVTHC